MDLSLALADQATWKQRWISKITSIGYFRLIRARTERFDLRYDSGVWFGGMIRGMIRGYDSRVWIAAPKAFISAGIEPWA